MGGGVTGLVSNPVTFFSSMSLGSLWSLVRPVQVKSTPFQDTSICLDVFQCYPEAVIVS